MIGGGLTRRDCPRRPSQALAEHKVAVEAVLRSVGARNVRVFGSVACGEDSPSSDIDLLVDYGSGFSMLGLVRAQEALEKILGFHVDIVTTNGVPARKREIVDQAVPL